MDMNQIDINSVLSIENINLDIEAKTKDEAIKEMVSMLYKNGYISDEKAFLRDVYLREKEGITGIGKSVAIPHGRSKAVKKTTIAIGRSNNDISWETFDDKPVRCIIMFAVRDVDISEHLILLSHVAKLLCDDDIVKVLLNTTNKEEIINIFRKGVKE